jgi:hypothetical protein
VGIRLDWEIEAEREHLKNTGEDPESVRARRRVQLRFVLFIGFLLLLVGGIIGALALRLRHVDWEVEQLLRDTVDAEVAALRIGDRSAFLSFQRSATDEWLRRQETLFDRYQALKVEADVNLTGQILDVTVDGLRARVRLQEIIGGTPYGRVWFYWRYEDDPNIENDKHGWRHVPPDYTFWGEPDSITGDRVTVRYRSFDEEVAQTVASHVNEWISSACAALSCDALPIITVEIVPDELIQTDWVEGDQWRLELPSPYTRDARMDMLFDPTAQLTLANLLAERLTFEVSSGMQPVPTADSAFVRQSIIAWLMARFVGIETNTYLLDSVELIYGETAVGRLLQSLEPDSNMSVLNAVTGTASLDQANLDWRDYLTWRLRQENERITARDESGFLALYDSNDDAVRSLAVQRFNSVPGERTVVSVLQQPGTPPSLRTLVQIAETGETEEILFRLVDGVWKRAS